MNGRGGLYLSGYDRYRAVEYARRWAEGRNRLFGDFSGVGGDCKINQKLMINLFSVREEAVRLLIPVIMTSFMNY